MGQQCCSNIIEDENKMNLDILESSFFTDDKNQRCFQLKDELFIEQKQIGSGCYSDVYLFKKQSDDSLHAIKILKDNQNAQVFLKECKIMKDVENPFVIKIEEIMLISNKMCIMIEYADQGTLDNFISNIQNQQYQINANQILSLACDILQGINSLHSKKVIHRDLKMDNLLVCKFQVKIADLGVATYLISKSYSSTNVGNIIYSPDEKLNENKYNSAADVFASGLIILQIIIGLTYSEIFKMKMTKNFTNKIQDSPEKLKIFIESLLNNNPDLRPTASEAFSQCNALKFDEQVINYINSKINWGINQHVSEFKQPQISSNNSWQSQQFSTSANSALNSLQDEQIFIKGMQHYWNQEIQSAEKCFQAMKQKNPLSIKALCGLVLCLHRYSEYINQNQYSYEYIQQQLKFISQFNPNEYIYYFCLAVINQDINSFDKCLELSPNMAEIIAYKGVLLIHNKQIQEGMKLGQKALQISENNSCVLRMLGQIYYDINIDTSIDFFLKSLQLNENQYILLCNLGNQYAKKNDYDKALEYTEKSLLLCPQYKYSIKQKFYIMSHQKKQYHEAINQIQNLFSQCGEQDFLYFSLAYSYNLIGDKQNALMYYTKSNMAEENCDTINNIAGIYKDFKQYTKAEEFYQKAINKNNKLSFLNMYILQTFDLNQNEKGKQYLTQLLKLQFDIENEKDCKLKIEALTLLNQYKEALKYSQEALKKHPQSKFVSFQVLQLISREDFQDDLSLQYQISELIQKSQGISYESTVCQLKYFCSNSMNDVATTQIIKYIEYSIKIENKLQDHFTFPFQNYINQQNINTIFNGLSKLCDNNKLNIHCQFYFLKLISLHNLEFSEAMMQKFEQVYQSNNLLQNNYSDKLLIEYYCICYNAFRQTILFSKHKNLFNQIQFYTLLTKFDEAQDSLKKRFEQFHILQQIMLNQAIQMTEDEKKREYYFQLKQQKNLEAIQIFCHLK